MPDSATLEAVNIDQDEGNFSYPEEYAHDAGYGLNEDTIDFISNVKSMVTGFVSFAKRH